MAPSARSPELAAKIASLRLRIAPIVCVRSGETHPSYPSTMLHFWLLTEAQLDSMAHFYSQSTPDKFTNMYPRVMGWDTEFLSAPRPSQMNDGQFRLSTEDRITIKRRKFAKFIGMRGCETPSWEIQAHIRALEGHITRSVQEEEKSSKHMKWF